jgi:predicted nucleic acid-binding protein
MNDSFLDTNIIIYSLGQDIEKRTKSIELISCRPFISAQVLNETANTLIRKFSMPINDIKAIITNGGV